MSTVPLPIQNLARQLLDFEAVRGQSPSEGTAIRVCEKLRGNLSKFTGSMGFSSLLSRALVLAKEDISLLNAVRVKADGSLEGFDEVERSPDTAGIEKAGFKLVAHLLGLLSVFIGDTLTLSLVRDVWPEASLDKIIEKYDGGRA